MTHIDKLLFGDNQFFGINHMSEQKARAQAIRFQDTSAIIDVLDAAYDEGIRTLMCTTHDRIAAVCAHIRDNSHHYSDFKFYPCMPYAHKYANAVTERGMLGAAMHFMPEGGILRTALLGATSLATRELEGMIKILIDTEMKMFKGVKTPVIFLQNIVVDLILGIGLNRVFRIFSDHVRECYGAEPGFITMNLPMLSKVLADLRIENPIVCASINKIGFRTCGGLEACERTLRNVELRAIAMSVFASGAIPPAEAIEWVASLPNIESIVFGASSRKNINSTRTLVERHFG